jgi:hypothetical protein
MIVVVIRGRFGEYSLDIHVSATLSAIAGDGERTQDRRDGDCLRWNRCIQEAQSDSRKSIGRVLNERTVRGTNDKLEQGETGESEAQGVKGETRYRQQRTGERHAYTTCRLTWATHVTRGDRSNRGRRGLG